MPSAVIGALRANLGLSSAQFTKGLKDVTNRWGKFGGAMRKSILAFTAVGTAAVVGLTAAVKSTINQADDMSKMAQKIGIPTEELSRLAYAADLSDVSLKTLQTSVAKLSKNMNAFKEGDKGAVELFNELGISATDLEGKLKAPTQVLVEVAEVFSKMENGARKTALAQELMGKGALTMIPMLNEGGMALEKLMNEAGQFGKVFTDEMGVQAEVFNDNMSRLMGVMGNLAAKVTMALLPSLAQFSQWLVDNSGAITNFAVGLVQFIANVASLAAAIGNIIQKFFEFEQAFINAEAAAAQFRDKIVAGFSDLVIQIESALAGLRDQMVQIGKDVMQGLWDGMKSNVTGIVGWVKGLGSRLKETLRGAVGSHSPSTVFASIGQEVMQGLQMGLSSMHSDVENGMANFGMEIADAFSGILTGATTFRDALADILSTAGGGLISQGISGLFSSFFGGIGGGGAPLSAIPWLAKGTSNWRGGWAGINEFGGEIVNLPRGSQVIPHDISREMVGGRQLQVKIAMDVDKSGNLMPFVTGVSEMVAGRVVRRDAPDVFFDVQRRTQL